MKVALKAALIAGLMTLAPSTRADFDTPTSNPAPWQVLGDQEGAISVLGHTPGLAHTRTWEAAILSRADLKGSSGLGGFMGLFATRLGRLGLGIGGGLHGPSGGTISDPTIRQLNIGASLRLSRALTIGARWERLRGDGIPGEEPWESWSTGITLEPLRHLSLALSLDRANTPLLGDVPQRPIVAASLGFRPGTERVGFSVEGARETHDGGDWRLGGGLRFMPLEGMALGGYGRYVAQGDGADHVEWGVSLTLNQGNVGAETSLDLVDPTDGVGESTMANRSLLRVTGDPGTRLFRRARAFVRITLNGPLPETRTGGLFGDESRPFGDWVVALNQLAKASDVDGVLLDIREAPGWGQGWEIRQALRRLKASGKTVFARLASANMRAMYTASVADHILLHPAGSVDTAGLALTSTYLAGLLKRMGIGAQFIRFEDYKTAPEVYTRQGPSEESREQTQELLAIAKRHWDRAVKAGRDLSDEKLANAYADAPHSVASAHRSGLVDRVVHDDELQEAMSEMIGEDVRILKRYRATPRGWRPWGRGGEVAVIPVVGTIANGPAGGGQPLVGSVARDGDVVQALERASKDSGIVGIVVRVSSPGGAVLASDRMHRAVVLAAKRKPLVVSFGDVAASGGYYLACGAPQILASPLSITGSIGVFSGKVHLNDLYEKIGAATSTERTHDHADASGSHRPWNDAEIAANRKLVASWYERFVRLVGEGRGLTEASAQKRAQGRVYMGERALALGLVDGHGSLWDAVQWIREKGKVPKDAPIRLRYPRGSSGGITLRSLAAGLSPEGLQEAWLTSLWARWLPSLETLAKGQALAQMPRDIDIH